MLLLRRGVHGDDHAGDYWQTGYTAAPHTRGAASDSRYYWLSVAESHLMWRLFGSMLWQMERLPLPAR